MHFALTDLSDGHFGVVPCCHCSAHFFDGGDGGAGGARDDDVDCGGELVGAAGEQFDAVFDAVDGAGGGEFAQGDGLGGVEAGLVDPGLDCVEVYFGYIEGVAGVYY
jgi:hypothetical protein